MDSVFLEVILVSKDLTATGPDRGEIADALEEALVSDGIGDVTGGGAGMGQANIDIEVRNNDFDDALALIKQVLSQVGVPNSTTIVRHKPVRMVYRVY
ncbi:MAG TPA: hypothetical protein VGP72_08685 [Planctomycetota bacterium]|jgi:hypothetical protein